MNKTAKFFNDVRLNIYRARQHHNCRNEDVEIYVSKSFWKHLKEESKREVLHSRPRVNDNVCQVYGCNIFVVSNKISKHNISDYKITLRMSL